jgi:arylsulfatase A-like enzyme
MSDTPPNVVLIHCHDLGQYLSCYGYDVSTPNLDAFASEGIRFDRHHCSAPQCSPSRGSMHTGRYPQRNGLLGLAHLGWELDAEETGMADLLAEAGYETHLFGVQHAHEGDAARLGFEEVHVTGEGVAAAEGGEGGLTHQVTPAFEGWVDDLGESGPFFASVGYFEPHGIHYFEDDEWGPATDPADWPDPETLTVPDHMPDTPGVREGLAAFCGDVSLLDEHVGRVLDAIDAAGLTEETLVVFTSDHGPAKPRSKCTFFRGGFQTALLARYPGVTPAGATSDALLSNVDLLPTILDVADVPIPENLDGRSFRSLLAGEAGGADGGRDAVYGQLTWHVSPCYSRAIRTDRYTYVENYLTQQIAVGMDRPGQRVGRDDEALEWPEAELYDHEADPNEWENLATDPDYAAVREDLETSLHEWMHDVEDPFVDGVAPIPASDHRRIVGEDG